MRCWLYGVHFILETDAKVLTAQLSRAATDLPGALVTRWLAWIRLFDFEVKHVKGLKHTAADGLSRRPQGPNESLEDDEEDIDDFIIKELDCMQISLLTREEAEIVNDEHFPGEPKVNPYATALTKEYGPIFDKKGTLIADPLCDEYSEEAQEIARFLINNEKPRGPKAPKEMTRPEWKAFKRKALGYSVRDRQLWKNAHKQRPPRLVLDNKAWKEKVMKSIHDTSGHAGRESTFHRVSSRYFWEGMYVDIRDYIKSCPECQRSDKKRHEEALHVSQAVPLFHALCLDVVFLPPRQGKIALVVCRDDFSGWVEARPLSKVNSESIAKFIWEEVICRHGVFGKLKVDGGKENMGEVIQLLNNWGIQRVQISAYNSKANGKIEAGHKPIMNALVKLTKGGKTDWLAYYHYVLFADRTTIHQPTGYTPFYMVYGREAVFPVETEFASWRTLNWDTVKPGDHDELLMLRARQIEMRDLGMVEAQHSKNRRREVAKEWFDQKHSIRKEPLNTGDFVLMYDIRDINVAMDKSKKLYWRWLGPFVVREVQPQGTYLLRELDGTHMRGTVHGNRLQRFVKRGGYWFSHDDPIDMWRDTDTSDQALVGPDTSADKNAQAAAKEWIETIQIEKQPGVIISVEVPSLALDKRTEYVRFEEDWDESDEREEGKF